MIYSKVVYTLKDSTSTLHGLRAQALICYPLLYSYTCCEHSAIAPNSEPLASALTVPNLNGTSLSRASTKRDDIKTNHIRYHPSRSA